MIIGAICKVFIIYREQKLTSFGKRKKSRATQRLVFPEKLVPPSINRGVETNFLYQENYYI